jgi:hypothetical protein
MQRRKTGCSASHESNTRGICRCRLSSKGQRREEIFSLEPHAPATGDDLKVSDIQRHHIKTQVQGCGPDDEIGKIDANAAAHLLAVDSPGEARHFKRHRMDGHGLESSSTKFCLRLLWSSDQRRAGANAGGSTRAQT